MTPVRLEPAAPRSGVKHSTTEPLRSQYSYFSTKTYVVGTQKNRLSLMFHKLKLMSKKIFTFLDSKILFILTYVHINQIEVEATDQMQDIHGQ